MFENIKSFFLQRQEEITLTVSSIGAIILAIFANSLYAFLLKIPGEKVNSSYKTTVIVALIIVIIVMVYCFSCIVIWAKKKLWPDYMDEYYMKHAFLHLRKLGRKRHEVFQEAVLTPEKGKVDELYLKLAMDNLQLSVQCCYDFFESAFTDKSQLVNEIKFEATFMTMSYVDSEITIPCSANKENRTPTSMLLRKDDVKIYSNTETAKVYKMKHPVMVLIENTASMTENYEEIYTDQKERIKSSVILPVLSHKNELLGTLVVHCNQPKFFKKARYQFWNELLEMFAVEIGYYKGIIDYFVSNNGGLAKPF